MNSPHIEVPPPSYQHITITMDTPHTDFTTAAWAGSDGPATLLLDGVSVGPLALSLRLCAHSGPPTRCILSSVPSLCSNDLHVPRLSHLTSVNTSTTCRKTSSQIRVLVSCRQPPPYGGTRHTWSNTTIIGRCSGCQGPWTSRGSIQPPHPSTFLCIPGLTKVFDTGSSVEEEKTEEEDERLSPSDTESVVAAPWLYCSVLTAP